MVHHYSWRSLVQLCFSLMALTKAIRDCAGPLVIVVLTRYGMVVEVLFCDVRGHCPLHPCTRSDRPPCSS